MSTTEIIAALDKLTVAEITALVKELETKWGVSAAAAVVAAGPAATTAPVEEKTEFDVILASAGANKIEVIKIVRTITGLGLKDAKDLVEAAPKPLKEAAPKADAEKWKKELEAAGAKVDIK